MIAYLDTSALVKRYVLERGSTETALFTSEARMTATSLVARAEVAAALARAVRVRLLTHDNAMTAQRNFIADWPDLVRVPVTEAVTERADALAWEYGLRGYDAVHLASALTWRDSIGEELVLATFDHQLWDAALRAGLTAWPEKRLLRPR